MNSESSVEGCWKDLEWLEVVTGPWTAACGRKRTILDLLATPPADHIKQARALIAIDKNRESFLDRLKTVIADANRILRVLENPHGRQRDAESVIDAYLEEGKDTKESATTKTQRRIVAAILALASLAGTAGIATILDPMMPHRPYTIPILMLFTGGIAGALGALLVFWCADDASLRPKRTRKG